MTNEYKLRGLERVVNALLPAQADQCCNRAARMQIMFVALMNAQTRGWIDA